MKYPHCERSLLHLFESQRQRAFRQPTLYHLPGQVQRGGAGGAVVVHVEDGDAGQADLVQRALSTRRIAFLS